MKSKNISVPAVDRAFDILEYIGKSNYSVSIKELGESLNIPTASCFRIVKNMVARGYLMEDYNISGQYLLGFNLLNLSNQLLYKLDLRTIAISYMRQIAVDTNHAVQLGVLQSNGVSYIEQILPIKPISVIAKPQTVIPVNLSAAGKVISALLPIHTRMEFVRNAEFARYTENSITDREIFLKELEKVAKNGYAFDSEEYSTGIGCLAVPIFDFTKKCIAALGTTGSFADYKNEEKREQILGLLKKAASEISNKLGYNY